MDLHDPVFADKPIKGWLLKWTNFIKGYQPRWFVLGKNTLSYFRDTEEKWLDVKERERGCVGINDVIIQSFDRDNNTFLVLKGDVRIYYLRANNSIDRQRWITAIEIAKNQLAVEYADSINQNYWIKDSEKEKDVQTVLNILEAKIKYMQTTQKLVSKRADSLVSLIIAFPYLDRTKKLNISKEIKNIGDEATQFRVACHSIVKCCFEFHRLADKFLEQLWEVFKKEQRLEMKLQIVLEQLLLQYVLLQEAITSQKPIPEADIDKLQEYVSKHQKLEPSPCFNFEIRDIIDCQSLGGKCILAFPQTVNDSYFIEHDTVSEKHDPFIDLQDEAEQEISAGTTQREPFKVRQDHMKRRTRVPDRPNINLNLWNLVKNCIGKDLTKVPMPVNFNEPISMLQRLTEEFQYSAVLDRAVSCESTCEELAYLAAFVISSYSTTATRTAKPFNPLLGETFEWDRTDDLGWRIILEQVSHHPPIAAQHCESKDWTSWQEFQMTSKFRPKYLTVIPLGISHLVFHKSGNHYTWTKVTTTVHNIIIGSLWIDQQGEMDIINHTDGSVCHLSFIPYSYFKQDTKRRVRGHVKNKNGEVKWMINGTWDKKVEIAPVLGSSGSRDNLSYVTGEYITAWQAENLPENSEKYYYFSEFACQLNEMEPGIAPTDSRNRPDQRLMENCQWDEANATKLALEEKQRTARRLREKAAARDSTVSPTPRHRKSSNLQGEEALDQGINDSNSSSVSRSIDVQSLPKDVHDHDKHLNQPSHSLDSAPETASGQQTKFQLISKMMEVESVQSTLGNPSHQYQPTWFKEQLDTTNGRIIHMYKGGYWDAKETQDWSRCPNIYLTQ